MNSHVKIMIEKRSLLHDFAGVLLATLVLSGCSGGSNYAGGGTDSGIINDLDTQTIQDIIGGATTSIVSFDGYGAAKLTTGLANEDKAEIMISGNFGNFGDLLTDSELSFEYRFYKAPDAPGAPAAAAFAAPALGLVLFDEDFVGDNYLVIKYEHYWNIGGAAVPTDTWITAKLDQTEGAAWSTGGLGLANSAGGPPLFALQNIVSGTASSNANLSNDLLLDFSELYDAEVVGILVGVGSYNQGQEGYVDYMSITTMGGITLFDFEP
jgi:hypothetical protein